MPQDVQIIPAEKVTHVSQKGVIKLETPTQQPASETRATPAVPTKPEPTRTDAAPAKPQSASEDFYGRLRQKAEPKPTTTPESQKQETKPESESKAEVEITEQETTESTETETSKEITPPEETKQADGKKAKVNPWKLLDEHKSARAKLEQEVVELKKLLPKEEERKAELERLQKSESRVKELEDEMRYVNYQKSPEFQEKYEKPYLDAWKRAASEISEIMVEDTASGTQRAATAQDIADLLNMPLNKARELASERFGEFANDVMFHRKELRRLFEERSFAMEKAKTEAIEREQKMRQEYADRDRQLRMSLKEVWEKASEAVIADPENGEFFKPIEGDEERNGLLQKGYELVDSAFSRNPLEPDLDQETRASIVRKHAAIRNRAAAFGVLKYSLAKTRTALKAAEEKLKQFEASKPGMETAQAKPDSTQPKSAWDSVLDNLHKLAK